MARKGMGDGLETTRSSIESLKALLARTEKERDAKPGNRRRGLQPGTETWKKEIDREASGVPQMA